MRLHFFTVFLVCILMLAAALFMQLVMGLQPCPLCVLQRIVLSAIAVLALLALLTSPSEGIISRIWAVLLFLGGLVSLGVAGYHVWLLNQSANTQISCGPGLEVGIDKFIAYLPQGSWTETFLRSTASCTDGMQKFFGWEVPELIFPVIVLLTLYLLWGAVRRTRRYY